jgi:hypothetical protein
VAETQSNISENGTDHGLDFEDGHDEGQSALDLVRDQVIQQARTRPYTTLAVAAAAGYVLGGGIPMWAIRGAASIGGRILVARAIASVVGED